MSDVQGGILALVIVLSAWSTYEGVLGFRFKREMRREFGRGGQR